MKWTTSKKYEWIQEHFWDAIPEKFQYHEADKLEDQSEIVDWFENNIEEVSGYKVNSVEELSNITNWNVKIDLNKVQKYHQKTFCESVLLSLLFNNFQSFKSLIDKEYDFDGITLKIKHPLRDSHKEFQMFVNNFFNSKTKKEKIDMLEINNFMFKVISTILFDLSAIEKNPLFLKPVNRALLQSVAFKNAPEFGISGTIDVDLDGLDFETIKQLPTSRNFIDTLKGAIELNHKNLVRDGVVINKEFIKEFIRHKISKIKF